MAEALDISRSISLVSKIHSETADFLIEALKQKGMPNFASSHGNILFQLSRNGEMSMKELSEKINRDKSTTTVLVRKLISEGLIESEASEDDKRSTKIRLTGKGKAYNESTAEISKTLIETFYKDFSNEEKNQFFEYLSRAAKNFEKQ